MRRVCIIPARGGSKRFPRKNVAPFQGKPIISYSIQAALHSDLFDRVIVSTEDAEISDISAKYGAEVSQRPPELASDQARVVDVCLDLLAQLESSGQLPDQFCCLYATSPLRNAGDVDAVLSLLEPDTCDFAMAVTLYPFPPHQALKMQSDGGLTPMWPELVNLKSQEVPQLVVDNGSTYAVSTEAFRAVGSFYGPNMRGHLMPANRSVDIDMPEDMDLALYYARMS